MSTTAQANRTTTSRQPATWGHRLLLLTAGAAAASAALAGLTVPAHAAGTYSTVAAVNVRSGPGTGYALTGSVPAGTAFTLQCQWQGGTDIGGNRTWDRVTFSNGVTGAISDYYTNTPSFNSYAPGTGSCTTAATREQRAVNWANARVGETGWDGWCEKFVENAFGTGGRYGSALAAFNALQGAGMMHYDTAIPAGALVFFRNAYDGGYGHVEISRGDGSLVTTSSTVRIVNLAWGGSFQGWSYAPSSWAGV